MAPCNGTQQCHHVHSPEVGGHPPLPHHSTLQWHPASAPRPLPQSWSSPSPTIAHYNGTRQWHPAHCTLQWHPCATSNPPKWFVALPPLLEVRTPIAIAIWGNWPTARIKYGTKTWWHCVLAVPIAAGNVQLHRVGVLLLRTSVRFFNKPRKLHRRQSYIISYKIGAHPTISHTKGCNPMGPFLPYLCAARFDPELSSWTRSRKILQKIECAPDQFSESPTVCGHALLLHGLSSMQTFWTCKHSLLVAQKLPATKPPENLVTNLVFQHIPSINFFGDQEFGSNLRAGLADKLQQSELWHHLGHLL